MVCRYTRALEGCMQIAFAGEMAKRRAGSIRWIERSCRLCGGQFGFRAGPCHINRLQQAREQQDRKSTRLNSSHEWISYAVFCLKKKKKKVSKANAHARTYVTPHHQRHPV